MTQQQREVIAEMKHIRDEGPPDLFQHFMSTRKASQETPDEPQPEPEAESEAEAIEEAEEDESGRRETRDNSPISSSADSLSEAVDESELEGAESADKAPEPIWQRNHSIGRNKHDEVVRSINQEMQMLKYKYPHLYAKATSNV